MRPTAQGARANAPILFATLLAAIWIMAWFMAPLLWAAYVSIGLWPCIDFLRAKASKKGAIIAQHAHAIVAVGVLAIGAALCAGVARSVLEESRQLSSPAALQALNQSISDLHLMERAQALPWVGGPLSRFLHEASVDHLLEAKNAGALLAGGTLIGGALFGWMASFVFFALALGYFIKNGPEVGRKMKLAAKAHFGPMLAEHLDHQAILVRSMFNSVVALSVAEALLFWAAFSVAGVKQPALYGALMGATSMIPLLPSLVAAAICGALALFGSVGSAFMLGGFAALVLFVLDPVIRPLLAGKGIKIPYWAMTIGMLAGLQSLGPTGIFIGPQVLLLLHHLAFEAESPSDASRID